MWICGSFYSFVKWRNVDSVKVTSLKATHNSQMVEKMRVPGSQNDKKIVKNVAKKFIFIV